MADYRVSSSDLTSVADAIRTKGGTSAGLSFPNGFITAIEDIPTGGGSTLITKNITANGTYNARSDNADGYSSVSVDVKPQYITGTFTGAVSEKGTAKEISVPYTGNGYPTSILVYPSTGANKTGSDIALLAQQNVIIMLAIVKSDISSPPSYDDTSAEKNFGTVIALVKYSNSDATSTTAYRTIGDATYANLNASATYGKAVRMKDNTTMSVFIADTTYGFKEGIEYAYQIVYSE